MDSLELLREARPEPQAPSTEAMTNARAALMTSIEAERQGTTAPAGPGARPRRTLGAGWRWGIAGAVAAAAAAALVISQAVAPAGSPVAPISAVAAELNDAAAHAMQTDQALGAGQYRRIEITRWQGVNWSDVKVSDESQSSLIVNRSRDVLYLPQNREQTWAYQPGPLDLYRAFSQPGWAFLNQADRKAAMPQGSEELSGPVFTGTGGVFTRLETPVAKADLNVPALASVTADAEQTLATLRSQVSSEVDAVEVKFEGKVFTDAVDQKVFERIWFLLSSGVASPAQQATLYRVLALLPTNLVTSTEGTEDGAAVTTFQWATTDDQQFNGSGVVSTITVDSASGLVHAVSQTTARASNGVPAGTPVNTVAFANTVVTGLPDGTYAADTPLPPCASAPTDGSESTDCDAPEPGGSQWWGSLE